MKNKALIGLAVLGLSTFNGVFAQSSIDVSAAYPDPVTATSGAGGTYSAPDWFGSNCSGYVAGLPDHEVFLDGVSGGRALDIEVSSSNDLTLVVVGPNGEAYCDDDSVWDGMNPAMTLNDLPGGWYQVYVGTYHQLEDWEDYPAYDITFQESYLDYDYSNY